MMQLDQRYQKLQELVERELNYAAHDLDHILRVTNLAKLLAEEEKEIQWQVLIPAALLHDIARRIEDEDTTGQTDHAVLGAEMAAEILRKFQFSEEIIRKIRSCIQTHRFRTGFPPESREAKILFDADKLDVIGAVGIARAFMLGGKHGERMYREYHLDDYLKENVGPNGRIKDVSKHSANLEFELKLKKIPDRLYTTKAKEIAQERIAYMEQFFQTLEQEIQGEK